MIGLYLVSYFARTLRETHVDRVRWGRPRRYIVPLTLRLNSGTRVLFACRKNMGARWKAHLITNLWLLDAPVASEINIRCIHV